MPAVAGKIAAELVQRGDNIELRDAAAAAVADGVRRMYDDGRAVELLGEAAGHQPGDAHGVFFIGGDQEGRQPLGDDLLPAPGRSVVAVSLCLSSFFSASHTASSCASFSDSVMSRL